MKTKTMRRPAAAGATGTDGQERGVHAAATAARAGRPRSRSVWSAGGSPARTPNHAPARAPRWQLRLYVLGQTARSLTAFANLKTVCDSLLQGRYRSTVIDLAKPPQLARGDQTLAIPTVVRRLPKPVRILIGTRSDSGRVLRGLDLRAPA